VWQCEQDPYCRRVLAKHWPGVPCHPDVRALVADTGAQRRNGRPREQDAGRQAPFGGAQGDPARDGRGAPPADDVPVPVPYVDVLAAGWPCPGFSVAGRGEGFDHAGSGLWTEIVRLVPDLRPRYVVLENVSALLGRGLGRVLGDLAACGYDAEWDCIPASAVGAPHRRDRVWLVAYPAIGGGQRRRAAPGSPDGGQSLGLPARPDPRIGGEWLAEPDVGRVAHGIPARVDRLRALGNALVPQIAEWLGRRILEAEGLT
jgi:DNA (cytosine-5)-methyltransferase 1